MANKAPDVLRDSPRSKWDDDPYRGVDVTLMQQRLRLTPSERLRIAVDEANTMRKFVALFRK